MVTKKVQARVQVPENPQTFELNKDDSRDKLIAVLQMLVIKMIAHGIAVLVKADMSLRISIYYYYLVRDSFINEIQMASMIYSKCNI